ncbi:FUSC family protein [Inediibacterium massiliense]|uniref:FUSC family protein n=1 Tax=Inediibacterium massiliense TaxID=1658111 RepID=UPI0006B48C17|nr:aromatic acid exporter family protein [Inediibacterium massiliense]
MVKIGSRNIKTAISVAICMLIFQLLHRPHPFYACIAAVVCTKPSIHNSLVMGKNRMIGTILGGIVGLWFSMVVDSTPLICGGGIMLVIYLCNICKQNDSVVIACIVFISIMTNLRDSSSIVYAVNRVLDTSIGIAVSVVINSFLKLEKFQEYYIDIKENMLSK